MKKHLALLVALFLVPQFAQAQDEIIKSYSPANFEAFIKEGLKKEFTKKEGSVGTEFAIKGGAVAFFNTKSKFVNFYYQAPAEMFENKVSLEKVNEWNIGAIYSRAYLINGLVRLEGTVDVSAGISNNQMNSFQIHLNGELLRFVKHLGTMKQPTP